MAVIETAFKVVASVTGANAIKQLGEQIKGVSSTGENLSRTLGRGALALKAFAASAVVGEFKQFISAQIDLADNMNDLRQKTGVAVSELGKYAVAAQNSGTSLEAVAAGMGKLNNNIVEAQDGTGKTAEAMRAMGISLKDSSGQLKNADQIMSEMADRFASFPDGPQKSALAMAVFGKAGGDMIPMLNMGSEAIKQFGLNIDQDFASASDEFNDNIGIMKVGVQNFGIGIAKGMLPALNDGIKSLGDLFNVRSSAEEFGKFMGDAFRIVIIGAAAVVAVIKNMIAAIKGMGNAAYGVFQMGSGDFSEGWNTIKNAGADVISSYRTNFEKMLTDMQSQASQITIFGGAAKASEGQGGAPSLSAGVRSGMQGFAPGNEASRNAEANAIERATEAAKEWLATQREELVTLQLEAEYIGRTSIEITKMKDARKMETEIAAKAANLKGEVRDKFIEEAKAIQEARQAVLQYNYDASRTFGAGARSFFTKYAEDASNAAEQIKTVFSNAFSGAEDALVSLVTTGKADFRSLTNSILSDLARMMIQRSLLGPLSGFLGSLLGSFGGGQVYSSPIGPTLSGAPMGFAMGGIMSGAGAVRLNRYASGGIATSPQLAMFGEGMQPEAYVPLPDGRTIPVTMKGGGGSQNNVSVVVNMAGGDSTTADSQSAGALGKLIASSVKSILINEKRPGGLLYAGA